MGTIHVLPERVMGKVWRKGEIKKTMQGMNPQALTRLVQFVQSQPDLRMHCAEPLRDMNTSRVLTPKQISAIILHWMPAWVAATAFNRKIGNAAGLRVEVPDVITSWNQVHYVAFLDGIDTPFRIEPGSSSDGSRWVDVYPTALPGADPREFMPRGTDIGLNVDDGLQNVSKLLMKTAGYRLPMLAGHDLNLGQVKENPRPQSGKAASVPVTQELIEQIKYGPLITAGPRKGERSGGMATPFKAVIPTQSAVGRFYSPRSAPTHMPVEVCSSCQAVQFPGWSSCWRCNLPRFDAAGNDTKGVDLKQVSLIEKHVKEILQENGVEGEITRKSVEKLKKKLLDEQRELKTLLQTAEKHEPLIEYSDSPASPSRPALVALSVSQRLNLASNHAGPSNCLGAIVGADPSQPYIALWFRNHAWGYNPTTLPLHLEEVKAYDNAPPHVSQSDKQDALTIAEKFLDQAIEVANQSSAKSDNSDTYDNVRNRLNQLDYSISQLRLGELWLDWMRGGATRSLTVSSERLVSKWRTPENWDSYMDDYGYATRDEQGDIVFHPPVQKEPTYLAALVNYLRLTQPDSVRDIDILGPGQRVDIIIDTKAITLGLNLPAYREAEEFDRLKRRCMKVLNDFNDSKFVKSVLVNAGTNLLCRGAQQWDFYEMHDPTGFVTSGACAVNKEEKKPHRYVVNESEWQAMYKVGRPLYDNNLSRIDAGLGQVLRSCVKLQFFFHEPNGLESKIEPFLNTNDFQGHEVDDWGKHQAALRYVIMRSLTLNTTGCSREQVTELMINYLSRNRKVKVKPTEAMKATMLDKTLRDITRIQTEISRSEDPDDRLYARLDALHYIVDQIRHGGHGLAPVTVKMPLIRRSTARQMLEKIPLLVDLNIALRPYMEAVSNLKRFVTLTMQQPFFRVNHSPEDSVWDQPAADWLSEKLIEAISFWGLPSPVKAKSREELFEKLAYCGAESGHDIFAVLDRKINVPSRYFDRVRQPMRGVENPRRKIPIVRKAPR